MANQSWGNKLVGSIGWILVGVLLFLGSFYILFKTEGRTNLSTVADKAKIISEATGSDDLVFVTGELKSDQLLSDDLYLNEGEYLVVQRTVEMFAWTETEKTDEDDYKYYEYNTEWVEDVPDHFEFKEPYGHENPQKGIESKSLKVSDATIGGYDIDIDKARLPGLKTLNLNENNINLVDYEEIVTSGDIDYVFDGYDSYDRPEIGDIRTKYSVLMPIDNVTIFGRSTNNKIEKHHGEQEGKLYRVFEGIKEDALAVLQKEYETAGWMGRIGVFLMMWVGLMLTLKPVSVVMELIPVLGGLGKGAIAAVTFLIALILTIIASLLFSVLTSITGLIILAAIIAVIIIYFYSKKDVKPTTSHK